MFRFRGPNLFCVVVLTVVSAVSSHAAVSCESLASETLAGGTISSARTVEPGQFVPPSGPGAQPNLIALYQKLPSFCRVEAALKPSADSEIHIEVWMPAAGWNGKLVESGNSAFAGSIDYGPMANLIMKGYAATNSDTGHKGNSGAFIFGHPEKLIDYGYRAVHENAVAAKAIVAAFYGSPAQNAYFQGCSTGGRQAYGEAQRYPADFDGIISGSAAINFTHQRAAELAADRFVHLNPASFIPPEKLQMLHSTVVAACDELDGVKDGIIENPMKCKYDPGTLLCKGGDAPSCLTAPQLELARMVYGGVVNSSGKQIFPGVPLGSELDWGMEFDRVDPGETGVSGYRDVVMQDPKWDYLTLDLDRDVPYADKKVGGIVNNTDPNLKPFFARGGKVLGYSGWADSLNTPFNHLGYYKSVAEVMGGEKALANSYRLFLIPAMGHCGGGDGTTTFDLLGTLDTWVNTGKAPDSIPASRVRDGKVDRTRPLCPYPQRAVYKGTGSTDDAANFTCAVK